MNEHKADCPSGDFGPCDCNERFASDIELLANITPENREGFEKFMSNLDAEHAKLGSPYGKGSLWQITGAECWYAFYEGLMTPKEALEEDMTASYD